MKIYCDCGYILSDGTDGLPCKARLIPDQEWEALLTAIADAIEKSGPDSQNPKIQPPNR
jgi:hypothetical protein